MKKGRVDIISLGCSKNLVDSERLMAMFAAAGLHVAHDSEQPCGEWCVVNTCGFIGDAQEESINTILALAQAKKRRKIGKLIVMGCLSERFIDELKAEIPEVDYWYGKFNWTTMVTDLALPQCNKVQRRVVTTPSHYAYLKVAEGCDRTCSYCVIPLITGRYKSRTIEDIVAEATELAQNGVRELQLIAQDITFYGRDLYKKAALPELLRKLVKIDSVDWIRIHYAYPTFFPYELLTVMREEPKICPYLDVALQHISDNMLSLMRRNITKQQTLDFLRRVRQEVPNIHLRTTLMVGHPGESEADFEELVEFVESQQFERLGVFTFSNEESTYAYINYKDDIPQEVKQQRADKIMELQQTIAQRVSQRKVGQVLPVIIDREGDDYFVGRTQFDSPEVDGEVIITTDKQLVIGQIYNVEITQAEGYDLFGKI